MKLQHIALCILWVFFAQTLLAQTGIVQGKVKNEFNEILEGVKVEALEVNLPVTSTDKEGLYKITMPAGELQRIRFTHPTHDTTVLEVKVVANNVHDKPIIMRTLNLDEQVVTGNQQITDITAEEQMDIMPISAEDAGKIVNVTSAERLMALVTGGSSNEFSSQYRVRGGNFDENLVYVNGIEIYRPFLIRSGLQEGLGFSNLNMTQEIKFSTGGFSSRYGDKLSSVLDVTYRTPSDFKATVEAGILTTNLHFEGVIDRSKARPDDSLYRKGRFTYLMGARRYTWAYLLNSLESKGSYNPNYLDYQGMFTYVPKTKRKSLKIRTRKDGTQDTMYLPTERLKLTTFINFSRNNYLFEPDVSETTFGTIQQAFRLRVAAEGREITRYTTGLGAVSLTHRPHARLRFDYTLTAYRAQESELFDVEGGYLLSEVNTSFGSDEFGEDEFLLGIGTQFRHARNYLTVNVLSGQFRTEWTTDDTRRHKLYAGAQYVYRDIEDDLKEYQALDSADFFINPNGQFGLDGYLRGSVRLKNNSFKAFLQHRWQLSAPMTLIYGVRGIYYDQTDELLVSPRLQLIYDMSKNVGGPKLRLRMAGGLYYQPPLYREFRRLDGTVNLDLKSQLAIHYIAGLDYQFPIWNRPFRFFAELYYKDLNHIYTYEAQNVRVRYYPDFPGTGYAYGLDARLYGQFIKGVDSWLSMNILKTSEDVVGDTLGFVSRPSDQRFSFSMYFQDELPLNPTYKVHVSFTYASGLPFGPPERILSRTNFDFPSYQRVDLGLSKTFTFKEKKEGKRALESIWATLEVFNLLERANTVSYIWIKDLQNNQFAVPNHLSQRLLNLRVVMKFE